MNLRRATWLVTLLVGGGLLTGCVERRFVITTNQDERGELYLFARYQKEKDNRKNADVLVLALEKESDLKEAMKAGRKYLEAKKQEESKDYKLEVSGEGGDQSELGISGSVGNRPGRVAEYKLLRGDAPARFWVVGVVNEGDNLYLIRCESTWEHRQIWRQDFLDLLGSVKFKKAAKETTAEK